MAITNYGVTLKRASVLIGDIVIVDPPELSNPTVESTNHASGGWREFVAGGLKEVGEFGITVNDTTAVLVSGMVNDLNNGTSASYLMGFPDSTSWQFAAFVTSFKTKSADASKPEALQAEVKFRPTGVMVIS
jgi:hypothetical protein